MNFWSGETLESELPRLIDPFLKDNIDCAAYQLRIGPEIYISPSNAADASSRSKVKLAPSESFVIPPGQFAFLLTEERVRVPNSAIALISMRAKFKFRGLVNVSGFHVDPGYKGRLIFSVFNAGPAGVHLARGDRCFLIWYASLDKMSESVKHGDGFDEIPTELITPIAGEVQSLASLSAKIDKVERDHQTLRLTTGIAITLFIALLARTCQLQQTTATTPSAPPTVVSPGAASPSAAPAQSPSTNPPAVSPTPVNPSAPPPPPRSGSDLPKRGRSQ